MPNLLGDDDSRRRHDAIKRRKLPTVGAYDDVGRRRPPAS